MTALPCPAPTSTLVIPTRLFGPVEVEVDGCFHFPDGLPGFGGERTFALLPSAGEGVFWLQDVADGTLAFLVLDPFRFVPGYQVDHPDLGGAGEPLVLAVATLAPDSVDRCTVNLRAPLLLDLRTRRGFQWIQEPCLWGLRHPVDLAPARSLSSSGRAGR